MFLSHLPRPTPLSSPCCRLCALPQRAAWAGASPFSSTRSSSSRPNANDTLPPPRHPRFKPQESQPRQPSGDDADPDSSLAHLKTHLAKLQIPHSDRTVPEYPSLRSRLPTLAGPPPSQVARLKKDLAGLSLPLSQHPAENKAAWPKLWRRDADRTRPSSASRSASLPSSSSSSSPNTIFTSAPFSSPPQHAPCASREDAPQRDMYQSWLSTAFSKDRAKLTSKQATVDPATLLMLTEVSPSLVASDFYRIGQQGKHIGGWASGLQDVLQRLNPETLLPIGEYILHFSTQAAAALWVDDANLRRRLAANLHTTARSADILASPTDAFAAQSFSLTWPSRSEHIAPLRGSNRGSVLLAYMRTVALRRLLRDELHAASALVVVGIQGERWGHDGGGGGGQVTMTSAQLRETVQADAQEAGHEWAIVRAREWRSSRVGRWQDDGADNGGRRNDSNDRHSMHAKPSGRAGASRFVMSFASVDEAHRFERWWHRRRFAVSTAGAARDAPLTEVTFDVHNLSPQ